MRSVWKQPPNDPPHSATAEPTADATPQGATAIVTTDAPHSLLRLFGLISTIPDLALPADEAPKPSPAWSPGRKRAPKSYGVRSAADTTTHGRLRRLIARDTSQASRDFSAMGDGTGNAPTWERSKKKPRRGLGAGLRGLR